VKTTGHCFDHLDFTVEPFGHRVGDMMFKVSHNVRQMSFQPLCRLDHGTQTVKIGVEHNAVYSRDLILKLIRWLHSSGSRIPGFSGFPDPGFRRGDPLGKGIILKLTALGRTPIR
jgi:hypothetical protein